jgi:DNA-binding Xre family transcriptional regulator
MIGERHGWLRQLLAEKGLTAADAASAWGVHAAVLVRFIKTGEPRITASRVAALCRLLGMSRNEMLARLNERPPPIRAGGDITLHDVMSMARALDMEPAELLRQLEQVGKKKNKPKNNPGGNPDRWEEW